MINLTSTTPLDLIFFLTQKLLSHSLMTRVTQQQPSPIPTQTLDDPRLHRRWWCSIILTTMKRWLRLEGLGGVEGDGGSNSQVARERRIQKQRLIY